MPRALGCFGSLVLLIAAGVGGYIVGERTAPEATGHMVRLPHHHPPTEGGASFRFAMAHDVIHERFAKHGPAFYREREAFARRQLAVIPPDSDRAFALTDDIAAGRDRLGRPAEAVPLLREKLKLQEKRGLKDRDLYTTYANLGTFLVHANMGKAMRGDADARAAVEEGLEFVEKSIAVNPDAHFGREKWQAEIIRFFLKAIDNPDLLTTTDCIGNRFDRTFPVEAFRPADAFVRSLGYARPYQSNGLKGGADLITGSRDWITRVGQEPDELGPKEWKQKDGAPFDEPMLGIIGMWRQGGGANPHFALCIGEVMLRVGQRHIAWTAFERAGKLADRYWPDPDKQQFLRNHCTRRQKQIEETLPAGEVNELRPRFEAELAYGERYQREYQEYEAAKIAAGADIRDEHFFDAFHKGREPIATPPGPEEYLVTQRHDYSGPVISGLAGAVFGVGLVAFTLAAFWPRRRKYGRSPLAHASNKQACANGSRPSVLGEPAIRQHRIDLVE